MYKNISTILLISTALIGCGEEETTTTTSTSTTTSTTLTTSTTGSTTTATTRTTGTTTATTGTTTRTTGTTTGTTTGKTVTTGTPLRLDDGIQDIFNNNCTSYCHSGGSPSANMDLSNGNSYDAIVGVMSGQSDLPRVFAGDVARSYMAYKLEGTHEAAPANGSGDAMPKGGDPLSATDLNLVLDWIADGAHP